MDESTPFSNHYPIYDPLSGAMSRRAFLEEAVSEFRKFLRYKHPFSLLIINIDHSQADNHPSNQDQGDFGLKQLVATFMQLLREQDLLGRVGEDVFGVLLLETDGEQAQKTAERLLQSCGFLRLADLKQGRNDASQLEEPSINSKITVINQEKREASPDSTNLLSISIGISTPLEGDHSFEQVFLRADQALNIAKKHGGNCVVLWSQNN